jgi:hypothetical protein
MRRLILAGGVALWLLPAPSHAQDAVLCVNCDTEIGSIARQAEIIAQWVKQIADMEAQLAEQILIFESLTGLTSVMSLVSQLNTLTYQNPMAQIGGVMGIVGGQSGGSLSASIAQLQAQNNIIVPTASGPMPLARELMIITTGRSNSVFGIQAIAGELLTRSHVIMAGLLSLQQSIDTMANVQHMGAIGNRINTYQGDIQSQAYQLQQVQAYWRAQQDAYDLREQQAWSCSAHSWAANTQALGSNGLDFASSTCASAPSGGGGGTVVSTIATAN